MSVSCTGWQIKIVVCRWNPAEGEHLMGKILIIINLLLLMMAANASGALVNNGDGTVTDSATGLMWQQATQGEMSWESALAYCESLVLANHGDWRLPNRNELQSLVDYSSYKPSINTTCFPDTAAAGYWSSTTYASNSGSAWLVYFYYGLVSYNYKSSSYYVRAVRAGQ